MLTVAFGRLEDMIVELIDKGVEEVRVTTRHDTKLSAGERTIHFRRCYVNVDALLPDRVVARYQNVVFDGPLPPGHHDRCKRIGRDLEAACERVKLNLAQRGDFTLRTGHFEGE